MGDIISTTLIEGRMTEDKKNALAENHIDLPERRSGTITQGKNSEIEIKYGGGKTIILDEDITPDQATLSRQYFLIPFSL